MAKFQSIQDIDQALIELLRKRLALLQVSAPASLEEQMAQVRPLLAAANISEFTWQTVLVNCMAALGTAPTQAIQAHLPKRQVTVVGGRGAMGAFFVERFTAMGHQVSILEAEDWDRADTLLGQADLVLIAVPLKLTVPVIRQVGPYLSAKTILADIASTKTEVMEAMLASHSGPVVGLHPMFGPGGTSFLGQKFVVCPGRHLPRCQWLLDLVEADGGTLITCSAEEHDAMMVAVQAIRFFSNFSLGTFYAQAGVDIERSFEFSSPLYRSEINTISRLVAQEASLYVDILLASPERCEAITRLVDTYGHLADLVKNGDREGLIAAFEQTRKAFQGGAARSLRESNYMLNNLSLFLAANTVEQTQAQQVVEVAA
jgi:prephenate dehydrogenase